MRLYQKILIGLLVFVSFTVVFYMITQPNEFLISQRFFKHNGNVTVGGRFLQSSSLIKNGHERPLDNRYAYNVWCIFTKLPTNPPLKNKFKAFLTSLLVHSDSRLRLNLVTDNASLPIAEEVLENVQQSTKKYLETVFYDVAVCAAEIEDIVTAMRPHFSSRPGTYYSDSLFFLSLGLHRLAKDQKRAVLFDADTKLMTDVAEIFTEFERFGPEALFALAPELTPVYRQVLYAYRQRNPHTKFGEPPALGFPGLNSGVVLFALERMRASESYRLALTAEAVNQLTETYSFKGHLGDQDFLTLLAASAPQLVHVLPCGWNRQLCTWWRDHGYAAIFDAFHACQPPIHVYHGNCNTPMPAA